jgi:hypothetical protein
MASIIKVVKMKRKGPVSFILLTDILVLLHKRRCAAIELTAKKKQIKKFSWGNLPTTSILTAPFPRLEPVALDHARCARASLYLLASAFRQRTCNQPHLRLSATMGLLKVQQGPGVGLQERHLYSRINSKLNRATALSEWR